MSKTHPAEEPSLTVGDIVIVHCERLPRDLWKLGRIQELLKGRDSHCRGAVVRTTTRDGRPELLRRPIQLLYPLELKSSSDSHETSAGKASNPEVVSPSEESSTNNDGEDRAEKGTDKPAEPWR